MRIKIKDLRALLQESIRDDWHPGSLDPGSLDTRSSDRERQQFAQSRKTKKGWEENELESSPDDTPGAHEEIGMDFLDENDPDNGPDWMPFGVRDPGMSELRTFVREYLFEEPAVAGLSVDPHDMSSPYTDFDLARDHMGNVDPQRKWYRSPGQAPGTEGDPFRTTDPDPFERLGFHPPKPSGEKGEQAAQPEETAAIPPIESADELEA